MMASVCWAVAGFLAPREGAFAQHLSSQVASNDAKTILLTKGLEAIEAHGSLTGLTDWTQEKNRLLALAPQSDLRLLLEEALKVSGVSGVYVAPTLANKRAAHARPVAKIIDGAIGYLYLPALEGDLGAERRFYQALGPLFKRFARRPLLGWIIDARDASGYLTQEMLATTRAFAGKVTKKLYLRSGDLRTLLPTPVIHDPLIQKDLPIALLQGQSTRLAGEALVMALSTRENVRTFGQPTQGMPYVLKEVPLGDGHTLFLKEASLQLETTTGPHLPDNVIADVKGEADPVLETAMAWIISQKQLPEEAEGADGAPQLN